MADEKPQDPQWIDPPVVTRFETKSMQIRQTDEVRDEESDAVVDRARVELHFAGGIQVPLQTPQGLAIATAVAYGYATDLDPHEALAFGEQLVDAAKDAIASMKEQPLDLSALAAKGFTTAAPGDVPNVAAAAEQAGQPLIPEAHRR